jgi:hypothetical protein
MDGDCNTFLTGLQDAKDKITMMLNIVRICILFAIAQEYTDRLYHTCEQSNTRHGNGLCFRITNDGHHHRSYAGGNANYNSTFKPTPPFRGWGFDLIKSELGHNK